MIRPLEYKRVFADAAGNSHIETLRIEVSLRDFAPPAPPLEVSPRRPARTHGFLRLAPGWIGDWHPSPSRQWLFFLAGEMGFEASDGSRPIVAPGDVVLLDGTTGQGHRSRVTSESPVTIAAVQVPVERSEP